MCSIKGIQIILFIENFIFWLVGSGLIGLSVYVLVADNLPGVLQFLKGATTILYIGIAVGAFLFFLGVIGCCGAAYHNDCLLKMYIFILILVICAELGVGIYIGLGFGRDQLQTIWDNFGTDSKDAIETSLQCCGFSSNLLTPLSCVNPLKNIYVDGCYTKVAEAFKNLDITLLCVGVSIALLEILGIIMSCYLACNKKEYHSDPRVIPMQPTHHAAQGYPNSGYRY